MEKKSERLEVRLGYQEKNDFIEACDLQGDNPSGAVRRFINGYVKRSDGDVLSSAWRGAAKRRGWKPAIFIIVFAAIAAMFWGVSQNYPIMSDDAIFTARDKNNDGQLEYAEHAIPPGLGGSPNGVMRVLDLDSSGTISRAEFTREGRMAYVISGEQSRDGKTETDQGLTLVEFTFDKEKSQSGTYLGATINAADIDRLVIWPQQGAAEVMEGAEDIAKGLDEIKLKSGTITINK